MTDTAVAARRTPLFDAHVAAGARMVPFAGWELPIQYGGAIAEQRAVRTGCGMFDVSHMGQLVVQGPGAAHDLQRLLSNDIEKLSTDGYAQYTLLTNDQGGIEDDLIVYRLEPDRFLLVVNAANTGRDLVWIAGGVGEATMVENVSDDYAMVAVQGPAALETLADLGICDRRGVAPFRVGIVRFGDADMLVATTGYTGELGCELMMPADVAPDVWSRLVERVAPCGLAARDILRLEACYPLHGNDIDAQHTAVEAGLGWACGWSSDFIGRDALRFQRERGPEVSLQAIRMVDRGVPRTGYDVYAGGELVGKVTSGGYSPTLETGIALAYIRAEFAEVGTEVSIDIRGKHRVARIADRPLYRRRTS